MLINKNLTIILKRLLKFWFNMDVFQPVCLFINIINTMLKDNGTLYTIKYMKAARLHVTRYICGNPLYVNSDRVSLTKGFPTKFLFLKQYLDDNTIKGKKFVLSLFNISRGIVPRKDESIPIDFSTITSPYKGKDYTIPLWFIKKWIYSKKLRVSLPEYKIQDLYISSKSGPLGPSLATALHSLRLYNYALLDKALKLLNLSVNSDEKILLKNYTVAFNCSYPEGNKFPSGYIGKLAIVHDPECKMRVIAMIDYFSQFLLKPIHMAILKLLSKFLNDRTFSQDPLHQWKDDGNMFYSLDLSAATDRFPISLQYKVIKHIYNNFTIADCWKYILSNREFLGPDKKIYTYSVGQPMGSYSSWAAFALTHHLVVAWSAHLCGYPINFGDYILLGDDIVIKNNKVARKYITIMTRLGVDISKTKTHVSCDTYEFAKRWIRWSNGQKIEMTGLPIKGIILNFSNLKIVYSILLDYIIKGNLYLYSGNLLKLLAISYQGLNIKSIFKSNKLSYSLIIRSLGNFSMAMRYCHGLLSHEEFRRWFGKLSKESSCSLPSEREALSFMKGVLSFGLVDLVQDSQKVTLNIYNKIKPLWVNSNLNITEEHSHDFLLNALKNHLVKIHGVLSEISSKLVADNSSFNILDVVSDLVYVDIDQLMKFRRNVKTLPIVIDRLFVKSINNYIKNCDIDEIYYGSWSGGSSIDSFQWIISCSWNLQSVINNLTTILLGKENWLISDEARIQEQIQKTHDMWSQLASPEYAKYFK